MVSDELDHGLAGGIRVVRHREDLGDMTFVSSEKQIGGDAGMAEGRIKNFRLSRQGWIIPLAVGDKKRWSRLDDLEERRRIPANSAIGSEHGGLDIAQVQVVDPAEGNHTPKKRGG